MLSLLRKIKHKISTTLQSDQKFQIRNRLNFYGSKKCVVKVCSDTEDIIFFEGMQFFLRINGSSDFAVFKQVLINEEYKSVKEFFIDNKITCKTIIDGGANIGLTTIYFASIFRDCKIVAVEPVIENFESLQKHVELNLLSNVKLLNNALHNIDDVSFKISSNFRGGMDWAKQTEFTLDSTDLKSITIETIRKNQEWDTIDLLKIDIEGAERFLFADMPAATFLKNVKVIALEIHDEYELREKIYAIFNDLEFVIFNVGETTIALNRNLI